MRPGRRPCAHSARAGPPAPRLTWPVDRTPTMGLRSMDRKTTANGRHPDADAPGSGWLSIGALALALAVMPSGLVPAAALARTPAPVTRAARRRRSPIPPRRRPRRSPTRRPGRVRSPGATAAGADAEPAEPRRLERTRRARPYAPAPARRSPRRRAPRRPPRDRLDDGARRAQRVARRARPRPTRRGPPRAAAAPRRRASGRPRCAPCGLPRRAEHRRRAAAGRRRTALHRPRSTPPCWARPSAWPRSGSPAPASSPASAARRGWPEHVAAARPCDAPRGLRDARPRRSAEPLISRTCNGSADCGGWFRAPVALDWTVSAGRRRERLHRRDAQPGHARRARQGCIANDGVDTVQRTVTVRIDRTPPVVTAAVPARPPDHGGWYTHPVTFGVEGSDVTSGVSGCDAPSYSRAGQRRRDDRRRLRRPCRQRCGAGVPAQL